MKLAAGFLTPLQVEQVNEDDWRLTRSLRYWSAILNRMVVVPEGFVTDFASVPRLPFIYWFTANKFQAAAVIHDWLYRTPEEKATRAQADAVLAEAMESLGYWKVRQWLVWAGVRVGGAWSYKDRS